MGDRRMKTLAELAVFVPIGIAAELHENVPRIVESGRERLEGRIALARVIGEMAVKASIEQLRVRTAQASAAPAAPPAPETTQAPAGARAADAADAAEAKRATPSAVSAPVETRQAETRQAVERGGEESFDTEALPIADYESLAASQVVARLPALGIAELDQVARFEQANRRRRTVLGKVDQLKRA
ncbi:hypothetical protein BH20ACT4_BH20ACT4_09540 [soil metagenome]